MDAHPCAVVSDAHQIGTSLSECQVENQRSSEDNHDLEDNDLSIQNNCSEIPDNHHVTVYSIDSEPSSGRDGESSLSVPNWLQRDETIALWVKWRGKWEAGTRCARADWPLATLKAKPSYNRKRHFLIFFPHTKNYAWADMTVILPMHEFPQPNACRTYIIGLNMVRDLNVARRFIMKKLAMDMLNVVDRLHHAALVDTARDVTVLKEFAKEAATCSSYSNLGQMLLKLQNMILPEYINSDWLQQSWAQRCQIAVAAESVELLKEELSNSILWNKVNSLSGNALKRKERDEIIPDCKENILLLPQVVETPVQVDTEGLHCIGSDDSNFICFESPKCYSLYCEKHIPGWLKCEGDGQSRRISKQVFRDISKDCPTLYQNICLHNACQHFSNLIQTMMYMRDTSAQLEDLLRSAISAASLEYGVGELLSKLVRIEKERLEILWGSKPISSVNEEPTELQQLELGNSLAASVENNSETCAAVRKFICRLCGLEFDLLSGLGQHHQDAHLRAQLLKLSAWKKKKN